jgi:tRNA pseudouridine38-40 synthase
MSVSERRIRLDLAYDGTDFAGWQVQPGQRTVQGIVEEALSRLGGGGAIAVRGAGRTDAGVHARQQVADGWIGSRLDDEGLLSALSAIFPRDLRPRAVRTVPDDFHSRKMAVSKTYRYTLDRSRWGDPLRSRYVLHHPHPIDRGAVDEALSGLAGRRDFAGFAGSASEVKTTVRTLAEARYEETEHDRSVFTFTADGFLNHMVRNLVGTLLEIGRGRFVSARIAEILDSRDRTRAGPTAAARGLCLDRIVYRGERSVGAPVGLEDPLCREPHVAGPES